MCLTHTLAACAHSWLVEFVTGEIKSSLALAWAELEWPSQLYCLRLLSLHPSFIQCPGLAIYLQSLLPQRTWRLALYSSTQHPYPMGELKQCMLLIAPCAFRLLLPCPRLLKRRQRESFRSPKLKVQARATPHPPPIRKLLPTFSELNL